MIHLSAPTLQELKPRIVVFGVGGAGGNAVNNMIDAKLQGVEFVVANTDAQALLRGRTDNRIQLGVSITEGLGAGARPEVGQAAAQESAPEIAQFLEGAHMVFVAAGMGGGTGTGAAPVIARTARERGILTVAVVTKPFHFEGQRRMALAETGVQELRKHVDTLIVIPNQNLFRIANDRTTFSEAFQMADQVLYSGVRGVTDLMVMPGLINLDFADVRTVMAEMGTAMMGTGEASGPNRALEAAHGAITNPLLDIISMKGARGVLINITGGADMTLYEVDEAANRIREEVDSDANIIFGATLDETLNGRVRISMVATGIEAAAAVQPRPLSLVGGTAKPAAITASRLEPRAALASPALAAAGRSYPATMGNTALSIPLHPEAAPMAQQIAAQPVAQPPMAIAQAPLAARAPLPAAPTVTPQMAPVALPPEEEADEEATRLIANAAAATPMPQLPLQAPAAAPARPRAPQASMAQPAPAMTAPSMPAARTTLPPRPATLQQAMAAASAERRPAPAAPLAASVAAPMAAAQAAPAAPAMPLAADAPFIAPPPVEPTEAPAPALRAAPRREVAREPAKELLRDMPRPPALEPVKERSSGLDLFKKVTGLAGLRRSPAPAKTAIPAKTEPSLTEPRATGSFGGPMGGLNPADRPAQRAAEDDLLDIPSFLRRQAN